MQFHNFVYLLLYVENESFYAYYIYNLQEHDRA